MTRRCAGASSVRSADMIDITGAGDAQAAAMIRAREIDILVNLNGYFGRLRQGVFARRPAPIQVNYLGFPGTLGADYIDYLIADAHVIPPGEDEHYVERIVRLPDSYQANDSTRRASRRSRPRVRRRVCRTPASSSVASTTTTRSRRKCSMCGCGCCVASSGSVLWLFEDNADAARNLRREARATRRCSKPHRVRAAPAAGRASRAPSARRSVRRHAAVQRAHDGERCALGRVAADHGARDHVRRSRGRQPAARGRLAGARHRKPGRVRGAGARSRDEPRSAGRRSPAPGCEPRSLRAVRRRSLSQAYRVCVRDDVAAIRPRRTSRGIRRRSAGGHGKEALDRRRGEK